MTEEKDRLVLSIETATRSGSIAVLRGEAVCAEWRGDESFSHSSELLIVIQKVLDKAKITLSEIDVFAAAVGPGSFTGLRVGIATVKGLTAALQKPAVGVPTLEAVAFGVEKPVCSILPAGRAEVFAQLFESESVERSRKMQMASLDEILLELQNLSGVSIVAPSENHSAIQSFINKENKIDWKISALPENLAVSVGKIALQRLMTEVYESGNLQIIYGRSATVGGKKAE